MHLHWKSPSYKLANTHLAYVGIIQSSINLIQDKERCRLVAMKERKCIFFNLKGVQNRLVYF